MSTLAGRARGSSGPADPMDVTTRPASAPDVVLRYAAHGDGLIDVRLPERAPDNPAAAAAAAAAPAAPLVVLLHGGFWRAAYDRTHLRPFADALAAEGFVVASPEYRRTGGLGAERGGWPTTFDDVRRATLALPALLAECGVALSSTTLVGHSAGGHLALWLANEPIAVTRVVALAPVGDLLAAAAADLGDGAVPALLGGTPEQVPDRYDAADPATRLAVRPAFSVAIVHGDLDDDVPVELSRDLAARHAFLDYRELTDCEHFAVVDPLSSAWPTVLAAIRGDGDAA